MNGEVSIWTDGACSGNPGPGGWGAILRSGAHEKELCGGESATTNNRMELTAAIAALEALEAAIGRPSPYGFELSQGRHHHMDWFLETQWLAHRR